MNNSAVLRQLKTSSVFLFLFFPCFPIVPHLELLHEALSLEPMGQHSIIACRIKTAQNNTNPGLNSKIPEQGQTGSFYSVLSHGTGASLKCMVPICHPGDQKRHRDSLTHERGDVVKLHQDILTQFLLCENLRGSMCHPG